MSQGACQTHTHTQSSDGVAMSFTLGVLEGQRNDKDGDL